MDTPPPTTGSQMYCCSCGYALIGLSSHRCPECGREFDAGTPKSFLAHPRGVIRRRLGKIVLVLFCLTLPLDGYVGYLAWHVRQESQAIQILLANGVEIKGYYDTRPEWAKIIFRAHAALLWRRADTVDLDSCRFGEIKNLPQCMAAVGNLKSLRTLNLIQAAVTDSDLANLKGLTSLRELYLADTSVTDAGLENLKGLTALHRLDLRQTHVTGAGLVNLKGLTALKELWLEHTRVTDAGLVNLGGLTAMQDLQLTYTSVTNAGLVNFKGLIALQRLDLAGTHVTDAGLAQLRSLTTLQNLNLGWTKVTDTGVADLQKALPNCDINH